VGPHVKARPRLSVVIPTRDTRELTLNCLASLWLSKQPPDEVVVVDDGGSDRTAVDVIRRYPRHVVARLPSSLGFTGAANHGMALASGELLLLLNSDTEVEAQALGAARDAFAADPRLGIAGAVLTDRHGAPQWSGGRRPSAMWCLAMASGFPGWIGRSRVWRRLLPPSGSTGGPVDWVAGTAMVVRRRVWETVGPFDESYRFYCQDADLCCKARRAGWGVAIVPGFRVLHQHGGTIASQEGAVGSVHPELIWTDVLRMTGKLWGSESEQRAFLALRFGGNLRLLGRRVAATIVPPRDPASWRAADAAYSDALRGLDRAHRDGAHMTTRR
jgi:hypothetical protein